MPACSWSGRVRVTNPTIMVQGDNALLGAWEAVSLFSDEQGFPSLQWITGTAGVARNAPKLADKVTFLFPTTVDDTAAWKTLCPAPYTFLGTMSRKYIGAVHAYETASFKILARALTATDAVEVAGGSTTLVPGAGATPQTTDGWRITGGALQYRAFGASGIANVTAQVELIGTLFPAVS